MVNLHEFVSILVVISSTCCSLWFVYLGCYENGHCGFDMDAWKLSKVFLKLMMLSDGFLSLGVFEMDEFDCVGTNIHHPSMVRDFSF